MSLNKYQILGIEMSSTQEEIKRAYFTKIRENPPEKKPLENQQVREAYETLGDKRARDEYDASLKFGGHLDTLWEEVNATNDSSEPQKRSRALKKILAISPENMEARTMLSHCFLELCSWEEAEKAALALVNKKPDVPDHWQNLGLVLYTIAKNNIPQSQSFFQRAREAYRKGLKISPGNCLFAMGLSQCYAQEKSWMEAFEWAEEAIQAHKHNHNAFPDLEALFQFLNLGVESGNHGRITALSYRLHELIPNEPSAKSYAAKRLFKRGMELLGSTKASAAVYFLGPAKTLEPNNYALQDVLKWAESSSAVMKELDQLNGDTRIVEPLKKVAVLQLEKEFKSRSREEIDQSEFLVFEELRSLGNDRVMPSMQILFSTYPLLWDLGKKTYLYIQKDLKEKNLTGRQKSTAEAIPKKILWQKNPSPTLAQRLTAAAQENYEGIVKGFWILMGIISTTLVLWCLGLSVIMSTLLSLCLISPTFIFPWLIRQSSNTSAPVNKVKNVIFVLSIIFITFCFWKAGLPFFMATVFSLVAISTGWIVLLLRRFIK